MKKTRDDNKGIMDELEEISENLIENSIKNIEKVVGEWTKFNREPKIITVDGEEVILL